MWLKKFRKLKRVDGCKYISPCARVFMAGIWITVEN